MIDLRSDTVTLPSREMRIAMSRAPVGDDVYREDPSVQQLEERVASLLGKEASLFVPSGTMGNLLASITHCPTGGELLGPEPAHVFHSEVGGAAQVAGMVFRAIPQQEGELNIEAFKAAARPNSMLSAGTGLIWVEEPTRGFIVPLTELAELREMADATGVPIHIDGARIFNASVALRVEPARIAQYGDSVMCCMSKGLGAPVGSLLCGRKEFIERARRNRQQLGGGMRQAGILAAAAVYALDHNLERLALDHASARQLAKAFAHFRHVSIDRRTVDTNIFYLELHAPLTSRPLVSALRQRHVLINEPPGGVKRLRFVTHLGITNGDVRAAADALEGSLLELAETPHASARASAAVP